ncbi:MAG: linear amide C-N hydrolase [Puniceicoccales bacterium]
MCTSLLFKTTDNRPLYGRTMEFGVELHGQGFFTPRGFTSTCTGINGNPGRTWSAQYAIAGMNALGMNSFTDGMNEKGLTGGIFYFAGFAEYTDPNCADPAKAMAPWELLSWLLGNFETVADVKAAIQEVEVIGVIHEAFGFVPPFHYSLHDATGESIVLEPTGGQLVVYDNPFGVLTNSPGFPWHLTNLRNYVKLSPENQDSALFGAHTIQSLGQGSGWLGLPGDPTPPSRFIRALAFSLTAERKPHGIESVRQVEHIMNNFDIPRGEIREEAGSDYTQWTSIADIDSKIYYVKSSGHPNLRHISLNDQNLTASAPTVFPLFPDLSTHPLTPQSSLES